MRNTYEPSHAIVDRLEKKYQKKIRFEKYKSFTRQFRQHLSKAQGTSVDDIEGEALEMFNVRSYEYIS